MTSRDDSLRQAHVHYSPLLPPTAGFADSQDALLSDVQPEGDIAREAGSSVADAPSQTQQVPADNLSGATNQGLGKQVHLYQDQRSFRQFTEMQRGSSYVPHAAYVLAESQCVHLTEISLHSQFLPFSLMIIC